MSEQELLNEIKCITTIDYKNKIIDITDDILLKVSSDQYKKLLELKKYKYSLQYVIE
mgnify:CR=1 FL=1